MHALGQGDVIKKVLPNGLTVLLVEDHSNPVVGINVWFKVGSVNETDDANGLAHFQEHMVFKGTERHGVGEIANLVKSAGGNLNAATSYSYTMYYVVLPSKAFRLGLDIQADAMMNSTFDPAEFQKERLVVIEEARMYDDTPDAFTFYRTMELAYKAHNYRRPIAGYQDVVEKFSRDQLVEFYQQHYRPTNAVLVVVGDVGADAAMEQIEKVYGGWKDGRPDVYESPVEPPQDAFRFKSLKGSIDHAYLGAGFHVPSILDGDYPALEMLATLLSAGKSSRLYRKVIEEKHVATTVSADMLAEKWPGFFMLFASSPVDKWKAARDAVFEEVTRFRREPVGQGELLKARRQIEKSLYNSLETVEGQASELGYYEVLGDYRLAGKHREAIRQVTPAQIMDVANKYLKLENCSMVSYLPESVGVADPEGDEVQSKLASYFTQGMSRKAPAPQAAAAETAAISKPSRAAKQETPTTTLSTLDNGVRVLVRRRPTVPMVSMLTLLQGGTRLEPVGKSGLSMLATRTFVKGTTSYSAEDIVDKVEGLGGTIESFSSFDVTGAYVNILSEHLDKALDVYREVLREPKFAGETVEKEKNKLLKELAKRHDHPVYVSIDNLFKKVFGNHPYAHPFLGDEDEVKALSAGDCAGWYGRALVPENMVMVFVGDVTEERALEIAQGLIGDLAKAPLPEPEVIVPTEPMEAGLHTLTRESLKQAVGLVGFMAPPMMTDESISLGVLNGVMTGLGGRLFVELRDKRSLGYMAGSTYMPMKDKSIFYGYTNPGPENVDEAIEVILAELDKVAKEPVTDYELNRSKRWLIGSQTMKLQRNLAQAIEYGIYESLGYGYGIVDRASGLIEKVTAEDIQKAAANVFQRDKGVFVKLVPGE